MSGWWLALVIVLLIIAIAAYRYFRTRDTAGTGLPGRLAPRRDFLQDRDRGASNALSETDRMWEAEAVERDRQAREGRPLNPEP
jgi:hypothetical protein